MEFKRDQITSQEIVASWKDGLLTRNPEYQRGEAWGDSQKKALIDSIFRAYPIPPLFLHERHSAGLRGHKSEKWEIIDGQQRILALAAFFAGDFPLLERDDAKLRLPISLRAIDAPWGGKRFSDLSGDLLTRLSEAKLDVFFVENVAHDDEIRDLFIRLQSGTALTRQQIRDAWPGSMGPIVEEFAGKLSKRPRYTIFRAVDGRGTRDEERDARDSHVTHRQTCAQLMRILFARMSNPRAFPSVEASDVDGFYHEYTDVKRDSTTLREVEDVFDATQKVTDYLSAKYSGRRKLPKLSLFALSFFFQDMRESANLKIGDKGVARLGDYEFSPIGKARSVSGPAIQEYYRQWKAQLPSGIGVELDQKRLFDLRDKEAIRARGSQCGVCGEDVADEDSEFDHHPVPHSWGGRTSPENGRLVHKACHPRGRLNVGDYPGSVGPP